jgi:hypothetical protein
MMTASEQGDKVETEGLNHRQKAFLLILHTSAFVQIHPTPPPAFEPPAYAPAKTLAVKLKELKVKEEMAQGEPRPAPPMWTYCTK